MWACGPIPIRDDVSMRPWRDQLLADVCKPGGVWGANRVLGTRSQAEGRPTTAAWEATGRRPRLGAGQE